MNIIIFSDTHFYHNPAKSTTLGDGANSWLAEQVKIVDSIFEYAKEVKAERIIFNGDLFEEKNRVNAYVFNPIWKKFASLGNTMPLLLNTGNHDYLTYKRLSIVEPFSALSELVTKVKITG